MRTINILKEAGYYSNVPSITMAITFILSERQDFGILHTVCADARTVNLYPTFKKEILPLESTLSIWL
jgi:hypothetical protein